MLRLGGLLQQLRKKNHGSEGEPTAELTFAVTGDYPDKVFETCGSSPKVVGQRGKQSLYSLMATNLGRGEIGLLTVLKKRTIDYMVSNHLHNGAPNQVGEVQQIARGLAAGTANGASELISYIVAHDIAGYGPISILLEDSANIEEIVVNSPESRIGIYHAKYGYCETNLRFVSEKAFRFTINKLISDAEKELNQSTPIIDAQLPNGSRLHAQLRPYSLSGAAASIRLSGSRSMDARALLTNGTTASDVLAYLWMAMEMNFNMVITGAPASGKTSLLLALNAFAPRYQRVVTVEEDVNELKFYSNFVNVVPLLGSARGGSVSLQDQVINALHLRPDRLIVGEMRGSEAGEVFSGANLGVPFMTTMHSSANGQAVINKLLAKPMAVEEQSINMLDMSIFMHQNSITERKLQSIVEYSWLVRAEISPEEAAAQNGGPLIRELVRDGVLDRTALKGSKLIGAYAKTHFVSRAKAMKELNQRTEFLVEMLSRKNHDAPVYKYMERYLEIK